MKNKLIVIINGPAGAGKDTLIDEYSKRTRNSVYNYSTIDYFKEVAKRDFGWNEEKNEKGRKLLSEIKRIAVEYNNLPTEITMKKVNQFYDMEYQNNAIMFIHVREKEETDKLIKRLTNEGFLVTSVYVYTTREIDKFYNNDSDSYASDFRNGLNDYKCFITNDDLDESVERLSEFINLCLN